jgi:uncharacterized membrane protein
MKRHAPQLIFAALIFVLSCTASQAFFGFSDSHKTVEAENGLVGIPLSEVDDGKAHHFKYVHKGKDIKFFVLKSKDGVMRAAFDACDVCYHAKKGYSQDGDFMVCSNCGMRFHSTKINVLSGGCNPAPLKRTSDKENLTIAVKDIIPGARFF